jgi:RHS repeat-associated protein
VTGLDYMHARYYSGGLGRFLSVDPVMAIGRNIRTPQRWNRYSYVSNNPLAFIDPDGREQVSFGDKRTELLFRRLESRHPQIRTTLNRYRGVGTPDLHIQRGSAGKDLDGKTNALGVFNARITPIYDWRRIESTGAKQDESSLLPATGKFLSGSKFEGATLTLDTSLGPGSKAETSVAVHELGHAESAATDPDKYLRLGADDVIKPNGELLPHNYRPLEREANEYHDRIKK